MKSIRFYVFLQAPPPIKGSFFPFPLFFGIPDFAGSDILLQESIIISTTSSITDSMLMF